jgi:hypothetical protein
LLHQLLTEGMLLVAVAGAAALLFARWAGDLIVRTATATADGPPPFSPQVDLRVLAFTAALAFGPCCCSACARMAGDLIDLVTALNAGGRNAAGSTATRPARVLVVLQVALSLVPSGTGLLRGFQNLLDPILG